MTKRMVLLALAVCMTFAGFTQTSFAQKEKKASIGAGAVDKAYLQKIWDGWATLDPAAVKQYYAQGPHVFFDIAPLKYASWDEYQAGVTKVLADYKVRKMHGERRCPDPQERRCLLDHRNRRLRDDAQGWQSRHGQLPLDGGLREAGWEVADRARARLVADVDCSSGSLSRRSTRS